MADTYTPSLRLQLQTTGGNSNTWGIIADTQYQLLEAAITGDGGYAGGSGGINITGLSSYTLTTANGTADQARQLLYPFVGALTAACTITLPGVVKIGYAANFTTGGYPVTLAAVGGITLTLAAGAWTLFYCDGTNVNAVPFAVGDASNSGGLVIDKYGDLIIGKNSVTGNGGNINIGGALTGYTISIQTGTAGNWVVNNTASLNWVARSYGNFVPAGNTLGTATPLITANAAPFYTACEYCYFSAASSTGAGVRLNAAQPAGAVVTIINSFYSTNLVYPSASTDSISGFGLGVGVTVPAATSATTPGKIALQKIQSSPTNVWSIVG